MSASFMSGVKRDPERIPRMLAWCARSGSGTPTFVSLNCCSTRSLLAHPRSTTTKTRHSKRLLRTAWPREMRSPHARPNRIPAGEHG